MSHPLENRAAQTRLPEERALKKPAIGQAFRRCLPMRRATYRGTDRK